MGSPPYRWAVSLEEIQAAVLDWYAANGRDLAFRRTRDPWAILVSEVIAQQTQAARAAEAWSGSSSAFPTPAALAAVSPADRHPRVARPRLQPPGGRACARRRSGSSRTTAAACPTRSRRCRPAGRRAVHGPRGARVRVRSAGRAARHEHPARARSSARAAARPRRGAAVDRRRLRPGRRTAAWAHALMDIGATICVARAPRCDACPIRTWCRTTRAGSTAMTPTRSFAPKAAPDARRFRPRAAGSAAESSIACATRRRRLGRVRDTDRHARARRRDRGGSIGWRPRACSSGRHERGAPVSCLTLTEADVGTGEPGDVRGESAGHEPPSRLGQPVRYASSVSTTPTLAAGRADRARCPRTIPSCSTLDLRGLRRRWAARGGAGAVRVRGDDRRGPKRAQAMGVPGQRLMEHAGAAVAAAVKAIAEATDRWTKGPILILCGPGNNGGDGFVAARYLARAGAEVAAVLVSAAARAGDAGRGPRTGTGSIASRASPASMPRLGARPAACSRKDIDRASIVVDALLGTGVHGELRDPIRSAVELVRRARAAKVPIVAVDTPTAVDLTSGDPSEPVVRADLTVTFHRPKTGPAHHGAGRALAGQGPRRADRHPARGGPWLTTRAASGWREVLLVAAVAVGVVLGAAILTAVLPTDAQRVDLPHAAADRRADRRHRAGPVADRRAPPARTLTERCRGGWEDIEATRGRPRATPATDPAWRARRPRGAGRTSSSTSSSSAAGSSGVGALLDATSRGPAGGARRAARHRVGHVRPLVAADPRRPALPGAAPLRAGLRGARRSARGCSGSRRTSSAWSRSCSRSTASRCSTRASTAAASSCTTCSALARDGGFAKHLRPSSAIEYAPDLRRRGLTGGDHLPRRGRGRRAAGARGAPDRARGRGASRRRASAPRRRCSTASG